MEPGTDLSDIVTYIRYLLKRNNNLKKVEWGLGPIQQTKMIAPPNITREKSVELKNLQGPKNI